MKKVLIKNLAIILFVVLGEYVISLIAAAASKTSDIAAFLRIALYLIVGFAIGLQGFKVRNFDKTSIARIIICVVLVVVFILTLKNSFMGAYLSSKIPVFLEIFFGYNLSKLIFCSNN